MKKYKNLIIAAVFVLVSLIAAFVISGASNKNEEPKTDEGIFAVEETQKPTPLLTQTEEASKEAESSSKPEQTPTENAVKEEISEKTPTPEKEVLKPEAPMSEETQKNLPEPEEPEKTEETAKNVTENPEIIKENEEITCTLSIRCDTILDNMDKLNPDKKDLIPQDGIILPATEVVVNDGESVFDILKRETKNNKIHFEFVYTPMHNSTYIEGIHNLYERDCGDGSGWLYKVNGKVMQIGCSMCEVKDGDKIEWVYTCKMGNDV